MPNPNEYGLPLAGFDGTSLLGFLAALGTLRTVALAEPDEDWRMKWDTPGGTWIPVLTSRSQVSPDALVDRLFAGLDRDSTPEFNFNRDPGIKNLSIDPLTFREVSAEAQTLAAPDQRSYADFIAAFGSDGCVAKDGKTIEDTDLRTMSGAGHQHFLGTMNELVSRTERRHLREAMFGPWDYSDEKYGLRWDPEEDRRYALRWGKPAGEPAKTVRGANRVAVEALPLFPAVPGAGGLETTGFMRQGKRVFFTWPVWTPATSVDTVRSLLALSKLKKPEPDRPWLREKGVVEVFRCERITVKKYRNFTRAWAV